MWVSIVYTLFFAMVGTVVHGGEVDCSNLTMDSDWADQIPIHPCHYTTHTHPRQESRRRQSDEERERFHHLAIFNIKYDLDFQEEGEKCSVKLQDEWIHGEDGPVKLAEYSFNRVWYKRLCSFFSFLECIPMGEVRSKNKHVAEESTDVSQQEDLHETHKHAGALPDGHNHPVRQKQTRAHSHTSSFMMIGRDLQEKLDKSGEGGKHGPNFHYHFPAIIAYNDSGRSTIGYTRMKVYGRGPGKGRHKSGPGGGRVERSLFGHARALTNEGYPLDGICVCSAFDPLYPDRKLTGYGINFVEDEMNPQRCVAAPGQLCGRVYFKANIWPGQDFEMSDHIGCPVKYNGTEYECIQWSKKSSLNEENGSPLQEKILTATCEKKVDDPTDEENSS